MFIDVCIYQRHNTPQWTEYSYRSGILYALVTFVILYFTWLQKTGNGFLHSSIEQKKFFLYPLTFSILFCLGKCIAYFYWFYMQFPLRKDNKTRSTFSSTPNRTFITFIVGKKKYFLENNSAIFKRSFRWKKREAGKCYCLS